MERISKGKYTKEFREDAVKLVTEGELPIPEVGRRLSLPPSTLANWVKAFRSGKLAGIGKNQKPMSDMEKEVATLRRELAEVISYKS